MTASFSYRNTDYTVSGWLWSSDGASNSMIVRRDDGAKIRGEKMCLGMIQIGLSRGLERAAVRALESARASEKTA